MPPAAARWETGGGGLARKSGQRGLPGNHCLGPCFLQAFVTKDVLFQIPTPHLRSSSIFVKRWNNSFHACWPGWVCMGQVMLAWQGVTAGKNEALPQPQLQPTAPSLPACASAAGQLLPGKNSLAPCVHTAFLTATSVPGARVPIRCQAMYGKCLT